MQFVTISAQIYRGGYLYYFVDGRETETSNWLRYVNCSRKQTEENVYLLQCFDKPFYITWKDVYPGQELLLYYGDEYAKTLNIDLSLYYS